MTEPAVELTRAWGPDRGLVGWLSAVNHTIIGKRFLVTAFMFFLLGGLLALAMRLQLAMPEGQLVGPDKYNQLFTMHGSTMMFLFAVPVMEGLGTYLVPLMVGARNIVFPRLNAFSYWVYLFGGITLYLFFILNIGPDAGWFAYVPLSGPQYGPGKRVDIWSQLINFTELSALAAAVEIIVTAFKLRAPGMSLNRMPIFVWALVVTSFMIIFAMPAVMMGSLFITLDRLVGTHFFNPAEGGDPILYQHLFWFFGHPEVYIIFIPALGVISSIIQTFCRRNIVGYTAVVLSMIGTGFLAFGLWVHHMFATGLPQLGESFFTAASMMIAIPTGIQISCWIATIWLGTPSFKTPLLWVMGFFVTFVIGGISGVMLASVPLDLQLHDTFFVVAHFHYVLIGGAVFPLMGGFYYWFPKFTGRMLDERLGRWNFWLFFFGFHLTFFPMHQLGLNGMPRRVYTYLPDTGWGPLNLAATGGAVILALSVALFLVNVFKSLRSGEVAPPNPWDAGTLEWSVSSPPPIFNFLELPVVEGQNPALTPEADRAIVTGIRNDRREVLMTSLFDAAPLHRKELPGPSLAPIATALSLTVMFIGSCFTPKAFLWGVALLFLSTLAWGWPHPEKYQSIKERS